MTIHCPNYALKLTWHRSIPLGMKNHDKIRDRWDLVSHRLTWSHDSTGKRVKLKWAWLAFLLIGICPRPGGTSEEQDECEPTIHRSPLCLWNLSENINIARTRLNRPCSTLSTRDWEKTHGHPKTGYDSSVLKLIYSAYSCSRRRPKGCLEIESLNWHLSSWAIDFHSYPKDG